MKQHLTRLLLAAATVGLLFTSLPDVATAQRAERGDRAAASWELAATLQQTLTPEQKALLLDRRDRQARGERPARAERPARGERPQRGERGKRPAERADAHEAMQRTLGLSDAQMTGLQDAMKLQPRFRQEAIEKLDLTDAQRETMRLHRALMGPRR